MTDPARTKPSRTAPARRTWSPAAVGLADLWTGSRQVVSGTCTVTIPPGGVSLISLAPTR